MKNYNQSSPLPNIAFEPNGPPGQPATNGMFTFSRADVDGRPFRPLTLYFTIGGTASNGVDYQFISNSVVFDDTESQVSINVTPLTQTTLDPMESVIVTIVPTNSYMPDPNDIGGNTAEVDIFDSSSVVSIDWVQDAIETNSTSGVGQPGIFDVHRDDPEGTGFFPPMTVSYQIGGTASNGVDYQFLSNTITFAEGQQDTNILINTIEQDLIESNETVTITILPIGTEYYIGNATTNLTIETTVGWLTVATNLNGPIGLAYHAPTGSLIVSDNFRDSGSTSSTNFARVFTNGTNVFVTNWSRISGLADEEYFALPTLPIGTLTNSAGFTNGDMFFSSGNNVGWLSADGTRSNLNWGILSGNTLPIRGGICMDQTGTFGNRLIVVTSIGNANSTLQGVWEVDSHGDAAFLTNINTLHLEGVTTITNDVQRWGPWAGKIITGDEDELNIYTIDTSGVVATFPTTNFVTDGIFPQDFEIIPPNSALYISSFQNDAIMELPAKYFTNNIGDLLIAQAGEAPSPGAGLFIVHWDSGSSNFVTTQIPLDPNTTGITQIEHAAFAPVQFP